MQKSKEKGGHVMLYHKVESSDDDYVWNLIVENEGHCFTTIRGLPFTYKIKRNKAGNLLGEIIIDRRNAKTIPRSSIVLAYEKVKEHGGTVNGPKKLGVFGASYLFPIFLELGLCEKNKID